MSSVQKLSVHNKAVDTIHTNMAYIATFEMVNKKIMKQNSFPSIFSFIDETGVMISGSWLSWQLCLGGKGHNVRMDCIIDGGSISYFGHQCDLTSTRLIIEIDLIKLAAADPANALPDKSDAVNLQKVDGTSEEPIGKPAIVIINTNFPNKMSVVLRDILVSVFTKYFKYNVNSFNQIFAKVCSKSNQEKGYQGLNPTIFKYVVDSQSDATLENSIFGIIASIRNDDVSASPSLALDEKVENIQEFDDIDSVIQECQNENKRYFDYILSYLRTTVTSRVEASGILNMDFYNSRFQLSK